MLDNSCIIEEMKRSMVEFTRFQCCHTSSLHFSAVLAKVFFPTCEVFKVMFMTGLLRMVVQQGRLSGKGWKGS